MSGNDRLGALGEFIRQQREQAGKSIRDLAKVASVSNPYLSQIERGIRRPSAEILQQIARALEISAETLYVQAGILDDSSPAAGGGVPAAVAADPRLTAAQRAELLDHYQRLVGDGARQPGDGERPAGGAPD